jgi:hypothetical protein
MFSQGIPGEVNIFGPHMAVMINIMVFLTAPLECLPFLQVSVGRLTLTEVSTSTALTFGTSGQIGFIVVH